MNRILKMRERRPVRGKICWRPVYTVIEVADMIGVSPGTLHNWKRDGMKL